MTRHSLKLIALAFLSLGLGTLIYFIRPTGSSYLNLSGSNLNLSFAAALPWLGSLPSFIHVLAFSLITAVAVGLRKRTILLSCLSWFTVGGLFELGQLGAFSKLLQNLPTGLGNYFQAGTFDPYDLIACALGAGVAYLILGQKPSRRKHPALQRRAKLAFVSLLSLSLLTACPLEPRYAYGTLSFDPDEPYSYKESYVCEGDRVSLNWTTQDANRPTLVAEPSTATNPVLNNKAVDAEGTLELTVKDSVTVSLLHRQTVLDSVEIRRAPDAVCTDFDVSLLGWFEGSFEQTEPEAIGRSARMQLYWEGDAYTEPPGLKGRLYLKGLLSPLELRCSANGPDKKVACVQKSRPDAFEFSASGTTSGLSGSYEGAEEDASLKIPFSGRFDLVKRDSEPPPL